MSTPRRGQPPPLLVRPPPSPLGLALPDLPPISALFLIDFDVKAGYTIVWKRAVAGIELEGAVEYKSLPSGLHTVSDDLIYFVHDGSHAGLSAFANTRTDEEETRHARMIAVGVLVPLSYGRLGRAWRHAESLKQMAAILVADRKQTQVLDQYWDTHGARETSAPQPLRETPLGSPSLELPPVRPSLAAGRGHARNRSASDGTALIPPGQRLSPYHPAWSLTSLLDTFGPLIFPIHRAALLRKRILITCHAPVHEVCNFVYDISVLSNIPLSVCDIIDPSAPVQRLRPLFTIGVHDISFLVEHQAALKQQANRDIDHDSAIAAADDASAGWVACTTDSILAIKEDLWDVLVTLPPACAANAKERAWPTVECPKGVQVKATQRDLRRYRALRQGLAHLSSSGSMAARHSSQSFRPELQTVHSAVSETSEAPIPGPPAIRLSRPSAPVPTSTPATTEGSRSLPVISDEEAEKTVEPTTWAALAYNGFMWWASAGEQRRSDEVDEQSQDASLLADLAPHAPAPGQRRASFLSANTDLVDSISSLTAAAATTTTSQPPSGGDQQPYEGSGDLLRREDAAQARVELAIIAYFHRLTTTLLGVLADIVDSTDDDDLLGIDFDSGPAGVGGLEGGDESGDETARLLAGIGDGDGNRRGWVRVDSEALAHMGLDVWSQADAEFVKECVSRYFSRRAYVETKGVEVCGVRVC